VLNAGMTLQIASIAALTSNALFVILKNIYIKDNALNETLAKNVKRNILIIIRYS